MKILIGDIKPFNEYHLDNIKREYRKQYVKTFNSIDMFFKWVKTVTKPLLGGKLLAVISDNKTFIRDVPKTIEKLENIDKTYKYIDIVWVASKNVRLQGLILTCDVINLKALYKSDFQLTVQKDLPFLAEDGWKELIKCIGYSWDNYIIYQDILKDASVVSASDIRKIIMKRVVKSAPEVLMMIIKRERFCLNNYKKLVLKYSKRWVHEYFAEQLDKIIETKIKYAKKEIGMTKIRSSQEMGKYMDIIYSIPLADIFTLRMLLDQPLGIHLYIKESASSLIKSDRESLSEGLLTSSQLKREVK